MVASSPTLSTFFIFHGGVQGLGTFYWENLPGLRASADLFAANSADEAERIVREHGITHLVMVSWDDFVKEYIQLLHQTPNSEVPTNSFVLQLVATKVLPPWLKIIPYRFPKAKELESQTVFVFEVLVPQAPEAQLVNLVSYLIDVGEEQTAARFVPALDKLPFYLPALIARGRVCLSQNNKPALNNVIADMKKVLPNAAELSLEERIHLGFLLAVAGDTEDAQDQMARCVTQMNEHDVRRLSAAAAYNFLYMAPRLDVPSPPQEMIELAFEILPPKAREQLREAASLPTP